MPFTCPHCGMTSHHPKDEEHGYCGACHDFTGHPTAELQLGFDLQRAYQMVVTRWQQAHPGDDAIPGHADLVMWLLDQLATYERLDRVDTALAKRLGERIARDAKLHVSLNDWLAAYPLDQFPEPDFDKAADILMATGMSLDAISASNMRHVLTRIIALLEENAS
jgi:hypothetical protein